MQSPSWYVRRLRRMSPSEVAWRGRAALRDAGDRLRFSLGRTPSLLDVPAGHATTTAPVAPLCPVPVGGLAAAARTSPLHAAWLEALVAEADDLVAHRFSFFALERVHLGDPVDWNRDHEAGQASPMGYAMAIDYRDARAAGDAKLVWEPSRHLHLGVLGRAYRATGDARYAQAALDDVTSWLEQCPFHAGMQWRSPLELAIRAINWTWLLALVEPSGVVAGEARRRVLHALDLHVQEIADKYSQGSSANNHTIGEAAGVFVAASAVPGITDAARHRRESLAILGEQILRQHHPDGGNAEQAFGYHLFVLQFLLVAAHVARITGQALPHGYADRLAAAVDFAATLAAAGDPPMYGDADDGWVIDLGARRPGTPGLVALGDAVLGRAPREACEPAYWWHGPSPLAAAPAPEAVTTLGSLALPDTGLYLLQWGEGASGASLVVDCGPLGYGPLAAHGHADALAVTLRAFGEDVLVDPGTYDYFRHPAYRAYFRSTRAHNTVEVDGVDQSTMEGPFMWGQRAEARCLEWTAAGGDARFVGEHDGYCRLADPLTHRRTVEMRAAEGVFVVTDAFTMAAPHTLTLAFHLSEQATVSRRGTHLVDVALRGGTVTLSLDLQCETSELRGSETPIGGWVSRGYHRKVPSSTILATCTAAAPIAIVTTIRVCPARA